jgi:Histidine kinase/Histidine kinase-, DNA gyrase B-, and HSP90-like ATPase
MNSMTAYSSPANPRWARFSAAVRRGFVAYARWLESISWKRFVVLSLLALIASGILSGLPPFNSNWTHDRRVLVPMDASEIKRKAEKARRQIKVDIDTGSKTKAKEKSGIVIDDVDIEGKKYDLVIDSDGVRLKPKNAAVAPLAPPALPSPPAPPAPPAPPVLPDAPASPVVSPSIVIGGTEVLPEGTKARIKEAIREAKEAAKEAKADAAEAIADAAEEAANDGPAAPPGMRYETIEGFSPGQHFPPFTFLLIVLSIVTKIMAKGRFKAEAQAVAATEMAESEALKRQVVEARMAAMQAQVEPHFLFNTLASIDHLIETDPARASKMQKNLIALLRASMPTMREANAQSIRDLGRELTVIRPYLEILKVRMEERLSTDIRVSDGLLSAEFPPMMLQSLVENAIKHGLEPKAEGGSLIVSAEIVHGRLAVKVADTGLGFGKAATAGTGIGLNNIRERLQLLYGSKGALTVNENPGGGTAVTITVPYKSTSPDGSTA